MIEGFTFAEVEYDVECDGFFAVEYLLDVALAGDVLNLPAAEVKLVGKSTVLKIRKYWKHGFPDCYFHVEFRLIEPYFV